MEPPAAPTRDHARSLHGEVVPDPWFWLRDREDPAVLAHLEAENAYTEARTAHLAELRARIYGEIKSRTQESDLDVPARRGSWWYATRTEEGKPYRIHVRMAGAPDGPEHVMLDENVEAEGSDYFQVANVTVSPDDRILAFAVDTTGSERYETRFRDLDSGADLPDRIPNSYYGGAWAADSEHYFYTVPDAAMRPWQVWRHRLGTDPGADVLVVEENDDRFYLDVRRTRSGRYVLIGAESAVTADVRYLPADDPDEEPRWLLPRVDGVQYTADHRGDAFWVVTNDGALDGRLLRVAVDGSEVEEVLAHQAGTKLAAVSCFARHTVVWGRREGLPGVLVIAEEPRWLEFDEPVYEIGPDRNLEYDTDSLRYRFESPVTPPSVFDLDVATGDVVLRKQTPVLGGYEPDDYVTAREWATARDGARIPVSIVRRRTTPIDGTSPLLVYAYGAYEISMPARFSIARLSLLDRGVVYAIAHVRGGGEMGKSWYEQGKLGAKENTFSDLIDAVSHLTAVGYGDPARVAIRGGSAGGLTVAAAMTMEPERFAAVVAEVPFVDVVNTMLDDSLPLTIVEWEEWGNPNLWEHYGWMRSYAPYEAATARDHPAVLATAGLNDPRVAFWEPAKWVAKLRSLDTGTKPILLKTEMGAGHFSRSSRYEAWEDEAFVLAFVLDQLGSAGESGGGPGVEATSRRT